MNKSNFHIQLNESIINRLKQERISNDKMISVYVILKALYEKKEELLDILDDSNKEKTMLILYKQLEFKGLIEKTKTEEEANHYMLTNRGVSLIDYILSEYETKKILKKEEKQIEKNETDVESWIKDWIKIFPEGKHNNRYLRSNSKECCEKMKSFINNYNFEKDVIFEATQAYISNQEQSPDGHTYTRNSSNFISKSVTRAKEDKVSDLATWCEIILNNKKEGKESITKDPFAKIG